MGAAVPVTLKNLEAATRVVTALCRLIGNAVAMKTDISDRDFGEAMISYDAAKRKLAEMMQDGYDRDDDTAKLESEDK